MAKNKLKKFAEFASLKNTVEPERDVLLNGDLDLKGKWHKEFFKNEQPIVLELGCGKGEYSVGMAERFPEKNFIGVDIKGSRMWTGAKTATENAMTNVGFLRTQIELIESCFAQGEVSEIWITFPDPQIKYKRGHKRLTSSRMLDRYRNILSKDGKIHLKTDSAFLHGYTLGLIHGEGHKIIDATHDLYTTRVGNDLLSIRTHYETIFLKQGYPITYICFQLKEI